MSTTDPIHSDPKANDTFAGTAYAPIPNTPDDVKFAPPAKPEARPTVKLNSQEYIKELLSAIYDAHKDNDQTLIDLLSTKLSEIQTKYQPAVTAKPESFSINKYFKNTAPDSAKFTPMTIAARYGDRTAINQLNRMGASLTAEDGDGYTPLMRAAVNGHGKIADDLIVSGATVSEKNIETLKEAELAEKDDAAKNNISAAITKLVGINGKQNQNAQSATTVETSDPNAPAATPLAEFAGQTPPPLPHIFPNGTAPQPAAKKFGLPRTGAATASGAAQAGSTGPLPPPLPNTSGANGATPPKIITPPAIPAPAVASTSTPATPPAQAAANPNAQAPAPSVTASTPTRWKKLAVTASKIVGSALLLFGSFKVGKVSEHNTAFKQGAAAERETIVAAAPAIVTSVVTSALQEAVQDRNTNIQPSFAGIVKRKVEEFSKSGKTDYRAMVREAEQNAQKSQSQR